MLINLLPFIFLVVGGRFRLSRYLRRFQIFYMGRAHVPMRPWCCYFGCNIRSRSFSRLMMLLENACLMHIHLRRQLLNIGIWIILKLLLDVDEYLQRSFTAVWFFLDFWRSHNTVLILHKNCPLSIVEIIPVSLWNRIFINESFRRSLKSAHSIIFTNILICRMTLASIFISIWKGSNTLCFIWSSNWGTRFLLSSIREILSRAVKCSLGPHLLYELNGLLPEHIEILLAIYIMRRLLYIC